MMVYASVPQSVDGAGSNPVVSQFESVRKYQVLREAHKSPKEPWGLAKHVTRIAHVKKDEKNADLTPFATFRVD